MVLEVLGTRLIAPVYGTSLHVWSAIIAVTLLSLSVGYWVGGRFADRFPRATIYFLLFELAALLIVLLPLVREPVLNLTMPLGLRSGALLSAILFLGLPLTLLGMISPYAVRLAAHLITDLGRITGRLYALSTAGSLCRHPAGRLLPDPELPPALDLPRRRAGAVRAGRALSGARGAPSAGRAPRWSLLAVGLAAARPRAHRGRHPPRRRDAVRTAQGVRPGRRTLAAGQRHDPDPGPGRLERRAQRLSDGHDRARVARQAGRRPGAADRTRWRCPAAAARVVRRQARARSRSIHRWSRWRASTSRSIRTSIR